MDYDLFAVEIGHKQHPARDFYQTEDLGEDGLVLDKFVNIFRNLVAMFLIAIRRFQWFAFAPIGLISVTFCYGEALDPGVTTIVIWHFLVIRWPVVTCQQLICPVLPLLSA